MKTPSGTESVGLLVDSVDEAETAVRTQLIGPTMAHLNPFSSYKRRSILSLKRDTNTRFGLTLEQEHLLFKGTTNNESQAPLTQIDIHTGDVLKIIDPKTIIVARRIGAQACVDGRLENADSSAPGKHFSVTAIGGENWGESYMTRAVIDRYNGKFGPYSEGTRVTYEYDYGVDANGGIQIDLSPTLEPLSVITHTMSPPLPAFMPILNEQRDEWYTSEGLLTDDIAKIVKNVASNILSLAQAAQERQ